MIGSRSIWNLQLLNLLLKVSVGLLECLVAVLVLVDPDLQRVEFIHRREEHCLHVVLQLVYFAPEVIDILLSITHILFEHFHVIDSTFDIIMGNALVQFLVDLLHVFLDAIQVLQLFQDILNLFLLFCSRVRCLVPFGHVLFSDFRAGWSFSSDFNGLATAHSLDHLPQLMQLFIERLLLDLVPLQLFKLEHYVVQLLLVLVEQSSQIVDLLLLIFVFFL